jgi:acyl carrier protein
MNQFLEKMADILEVEVTDLAASTKFRDLSGWDSLAQLSFLVLAQDDYNKALTSDHLKSATTVEDLFQLVIA